MKAFNNQGELTGEICTGLTDKGDRITTNTMYDRGSPVMQNITIRRSMELLRRRTSSAGKFCPSPDRQGGFPTGAQSR